MIGLGRAQVAEQRLEVGAVGADHVGPVAVELRQRAPRARARSRRTAAAPAGRPVEAVWRRTARTASTHGAVERQDRGLRGSEIAAPPAGSTSERKRSRCAASAGNEAGSRKERQRRAGAAAAVQRHAGRPAARPATGSTRDRAGRRAARAAAAGQGRRRFESQPDRGPAGGRCRGSRARGRRRGRRPPGSRRCWARRISSSGRNGKRAWRGASQAIRAVQARRARRLTWPPSGGAAAACERDHGANLPRSGAGDRIDE